jgi:hypothetical protein
MKEINGALHSLLFQQSNNNNNNNNNTDNTKSGRYFPPCIPLPKDLLNILYSYHILPSKSILNILTDDFDFYFDKFLHAKISEVKDFGRYYVRFLLDHKPIRFFFPAMIRYTLRNKKPYFSFKFKMEDEPLFFKNIKSLNYLDKRILTLCNNHHFKKSDDESDTSAITIPDWDSLLTPDNADDRIVLPKEELYQNYIFEFQPALSRIADIPREGSDPIKIFTCTDPSNGSSNIKLIGFENISDDDNVLNRFL